VIPALALHAGVAISAMAALLLFYSYCYPLHHDLAGSVLSGRLAVTLGHSYRNYNIYFPPAERIWYSIAARLSDWTGLRLDLAIAATTGAMALISAEFAYWIRRQTVGASPLFFVVSVAALLIPPILFKNIFGLREHIVVLGLWPYLVLRVSDPDSTHIGWRSRALLGLWLGATLLLKYLYSAVVLLVEIADSSIQRRPSLLIRTENIVAGAIVAVYLFSWLILESSQRMAIGAMYSAIDANLEDPATNMLKVIVFLGYAIAFLLVLRGFQVPRRLMALGFATVAGTIAVALSQERWYTHHLFPIFFAFGAWWWMSRRHFPLWGHIAVVLALSYSILGEFVSTFQYNAQVAELGHAIDAAGLSVRGKRVGVLNMHPSPYNQYFASHDALRWNGLMNNAYVASELKPFDTKLNVGKLPPPVKLHDPGRRMLHDQMLRLWEDKPPDVLILDHSTSWPLRYIKVDWLHEFSEDSRFNAILRRYRPVLNYRGRLVSFTYYARVD